MKVIFDTRNIYYLPQFLPVYRELIKRGHQAQFVYYRSKDDQTQFEPLLRELKLPAKWLDDSDQVKDYYLREKADWVFFGSSFGYIDELHQVSRSAQLGHGIGPKPSYYRKSNSAMTVRFIEGALRLKVIEEMYPHDCFVQVGYSKLDPLVNGTESSFDLSQHGLRDDRQTILYAPTFNPSSLECFPDNWPALFDDYNIIIKPHTFTYSRKRYGGQRKKLSRWSHFDNVYVARAEDISLLPFMKHADILISEASSTLFEFVALDRPVIVCDFVKLKWFYRGPFRYRFERRFSRDNVIYQDIGQHIQSFRELPGAVANELANPERYRQNRARYTEDHVGPIDGKASQRIVDYIQKQLTMDVQSEQTGKACESPSTIKPALSNHIRV